VSADDLEVVLKTIEAQLTAILGVKGLSGQALETVSDLVNVANLFPGNAEGSLFFCHHLDFCCWLTCSRVFLVDAATVSGLASEEKDVLYSQTSLLNMRLLRLTKKLLAFSNQVSISLAPHQKRKRKETAKAVGHQPDMLFDVTLKVSQSVSLLFDCLFVSNDSHSSFMLDWTR